MNTSRFRIKIESVFKTTIFLVVDGDFSKIIGLLGVPKEVQFSGVHVSGKVMCYDLHKKTDCERCWNKDIIPSW